MKQLSFGRALNSDSRNDCVYFFKDLTSNFAFSENFSVFEKWDPSLKGCRVILKNMKTKKYNGALGFIHGPARDGRVVVKLTGHFSGKRISVKMENCNGFGLPGHEENGYSLEE